MNIHCLIKKSLSIYAQVVASRLDFAVLLTVLAIGSLGCSNAHKDKGSLDDCTPSPIDERAGHQALLGTRFSSLDDLKETVHIVYFDQNEQSADPPGVQVSHCSQGQKVVSILETGIHEGDFRKAQKSVWSKLELVFRSPWAVSQREDLLAIYHLARRRPDLFEAGDPAFFDLAQQMTWHIDTLELRKMSIADTGEKGYLNTFNHIVAQAFVTSVFSEDLADFIADSHERYHMPELLHGEFTEEQLVDPVKNPLDNYVDVINNEWGQEIGKKLKAKYGLNRKTIWTPELLANFLNDLQLHFTGSFEIGFAPFHRDDVLIQRFSAKLNRVLPR